MRFTFDPAEDARNIAERGLSSERAADLAWDSALTVEDTRRNCGKLRLCVLALLHGRLYAVVVTPRQNELRVISFRKASRKEERLYEHYQATQP